MKVRRLGNSGLKVSVVGLGCNNFGMRIDAAQTDAVVNAAIDAGAALAKLEQLVTRTHALAVA